MSKNISGPYSHIKQTLYDRELYMIKYSVIIAQKGDNEIFMLTVEMNRFFPEEYLT